MGAAGGWQELPHHPAPWLYLLGVPGLLLAGYLNLRAWRADPEPPLASIEEVARTDEPLRWNDPDARVLKPLARGLSRFLRNVNTRPPLTLAITGRWGSGKSSLMGLLMADLQHRGGRAVWFNAWHHREEEHLLAALFESIRRAAPPGWWSWPGLAFRAWLFWGRTKGLLVHLAYVALFAAITLVTVHVAVPDAGSALAERLAQRVDKLLDGDDAKSWQAILGAIAGSGGLLALLGLWLRGKLVALPANPAKLVAALTRRASLGDFSDKLAFRHRFGQQLKEVCEALLTRTSPGLIILIDDLDRCQPADVLKVLEAVNYLVSAGPCTIVLGMDRRQVEYCVGLGFEKLVAGLPEGELIYAGEESADEGGKQRAFARHYLEKLINIEVPVPALDDAAMDAMLLRGTTHDAAEGDDGPAWLQAVKRWSEGAWQIARVALLAYVLGMVLTWAVEHVSAPTTEHASNTPPTQTQTDPGPDAPSASGVATPSTPQPGPDLKPVQVHVEPTPTMHVPPPARHWLWWAPALLVLGTAVLFNASTIVHRERQVVKDSPAFARALGAVRPLLTAVRASPRAVKRYQNRMRYLAARLRPPVHEPDRIDSLLHWLGPRLFRRPLVPPVWFEERPGQAVAEPALILLGAIELFAPKAFAGSPAELLASLDSMPRASGPGPGRPFATASPPWGSRPDAGRRVM
jgi:hypothetical protein